MILTDSETSREALVQAQGGRRQRPCPEARVRVTQLVFGPYSPFPVAARVRPDVKQVQDIAERVKAVLQASPMMRTVNTDWGSRVPVLHFTLDQNRLQATGLTSSAVAGQLQFLLSGVPVTSVREDIRSVEVVARAAVISALTRQNRRIYPVGNAGQRVPLSQIGKIEVGMEDPVLRRRDRTPRLPYGAISPTIFSRRTCRSPS